MKIRVFSALLFSILLYTCGSAQSVPDRLLTGHSELDEKLSRLIKADPQALNAHEANDLPNAVFLDAREAEEYAISHLPEAQLIGYEKPDYAILDQLEPATPLIVYCTVGVRSERVAAELRKRGFHQVYNLYGSLYAWKLAGLPLINLHGQKTNQLHTFNKKWSTLIPDTLGEKVW